MAFLSVVPKLLSLQLLLNNEYRLQRSIGTDIHFITNEIKIQYLELEQLAKVRRDHLDKHAKLREEEIIELFYNTEVEVDKLLMRPPNSAGFKGLMKKMFSLFNNSKTRIHLNFIAGKIENMKAEAQRVAKRGAGYKKPSIVDNPASMTSIDPHIAGPYKDLVSIDGKKDQELMKLLADGDNVPNKELKVVSVVGFGGLGKTTLVKAVYDKIQRRFQCKAFVVAGQNADVGQVLRNIIADPSMYGSHLDTLDKQQLIEKLRNILEDKRYLIVIDDIWNVNLWGNIKYAFSNESNLGSRIITTTRIVSVSKACCSSTNDSVYQMEPLSDDDSKKLLHESIFGSVSGCPQEFEQDILKKCGGSPLAITAMASVLASDPVWMKPKDEWHALLKTIGRDDVRWENMQVILSLSYYDLEHHLKAFLLHLSTFHVTHTIQKYRLMKKLIAEGNCYRELSKLAERSNCYLDILVDRNVIHPLECNNDGEVITYHIHPMMHDVLKAIAIKEKFAALLDDDDISRKHCMNFPRLSIDCQDSKNIIHLSSMTFDGGVRSLTVFGHANQFLLRHFEYILVLDVEGCKSIGRADVEYICSMALLKQLCLAKTNITELPPQIGNLQYLEGLDVGGTQITELPPQIGKLQYLEGLDIGGTQITKLPPQIVKLQHLKTLDARKSRFKDIPHQVVQLTRLVHLLIGDNESCEGVKLPDGIGKMTSLKQLCTIDLRKCSVSSLKELADLPCLQEIAVVSGDERKDTRKNSALLSYLDRPYERRSLVVYNDFRITPSTPQTSSRYQYLECRKKLTVVRSLKVPIFFKEHHLIGMLDISVCKLEEDDLKILREMPTLQNLIVRLEVLPTKMIRISSEGFAKLESFYVDCRMPRVVFEEGAMPKLEHLELKLYTGSDSKEHMCIKHLLNLQKVTLRYSKWYATNKGVRETTEAVKTECKKHQNELTLCIAEEEKNGICNMKTEIFQENKDASCSVMTKIEEEKEDGHVNGTGYFLNGDDTQEVNLHQSSSDIASSSGTKEIEEVVE